MSLSAARALSGLKSGGLLTCVSSPDVPTGIFAMSSTRISSDSTGVSTAAMMSSYIVICTAARSVWNSCAVYLAHVLRIALLARSLRFLT